MKKTKIGIVGLGYVGLPLAILFSEKYQVIGYDQNKLRITELQNYNDKTNEIISSDLKKKIHNSLHVTSDKLDLKTCDIYIIAVPTPVDDNKNPDLKILKSATKTVGTLISKGNIVIFESTVFPGCTEEICIPIIEANSKLECNKDFYCGYSPERVNPGDKEHTIDKIVKVTSGSNDYSSKIIDELYSSVITAGTHSAPSIIVAEAAKVIENAQRDINIAFINELSRIFSVMDIDTLEVLEAASTKWNFLNFKPGLVGGHCIGVDPYYLASKAKEVGYHPEIILAGRNVNDSMGKFISNEVIKLLKGSPLKENNVLILGASFKENCPDFRNTKVIDIIKSLSKNGLEVEVFDPWIDNKLFKEEYNIEILSTLPEKKYNAIILAVSHDCFYDIDLNKVKSKKYNVIYDIKGFFNKKIVTKRL
jgi:UDP-N-acetyl-D-galactosamine dehydrogenase